MSRHDDEVHDEPDDRKLDALLTQWADRNAIDSVKRPCLTRNVLAAPRPSPRGDSGLRRRVPARSTWVVATGVAVMVLIGVTSSLRRPNTHRASVEVRRVDPGALVKLAALWSETSRLFGPQLDWLADINGETSASELLMGINDGLPKAAESEPERVGVRLVVRTRNARSGGWSDVWSGWWICPTGTTVDFQTADGRTSGSLWVQSRPNGRFVVSHWLNWREHPELSGPLEAEVTTGESAVLADQLTGGYEVQVVQEVWRSPVG